MNELKPLVSVVVITYNSSDTIVKTLNSVKNQTYQNLELIVSDDCSTDNTVAIIRDWIVNNGKRFVRTKLIEAPQNTGVAPNCNRGMREVHGEWIKGLSGDDNLLANSIADYVDFVMANPECSICFGKFHFWGDNAELVKKNKEQYERVYYPYLRADWKTQWKRIQETLFVPGPGLFYKKALYDEVGGLDDRFPFADEYPFTYNILEKGHRIYFLDKEVYDYQIRENSLCRTELGLHPRVFESQYAYIRSVHVRKLVKHGYSLIALDVLINYYLRSLKYTHSSSLKQHLAWFVKFLSPYAYKRKIEYWIYGKYGKCIDNLNR